MKIALRLLGAFLTMALAGGVSAFGCSDRQPAPPLNTTPALALEASPGQILPNGATASVKVTAYDTVAKAPGTGSVRISAAHGTFNGQPGSIDVPLSAGAAQANYACDVTADPLCIGAQILSANWNNNVATGTVLVTRTPVLDAGSDAAPRREPTVISHVSTACSGVPCGILGVKGTGFQEQADVTFVLKDAAGKEVPNYPVTFFIDQPPAETKVNVGATSDATGKVVARVQAGKVLGVFNVRAVAKAGDVEVVSPAIGIRGVKPANRGFSLQCDTKNLGAYASAAPPLPLNSVCNVKLVDRFNNPVGKATTVNFKTESGTVPSSAITVAFDSAPAATNDKEGLGQFTFATSGSFPPRDVTPLIALGEPSGSAGNRRDGLVTIMAYVSGEEYFEDKNASGSRDPGESFIDQGEPFVDENDNNAWDVGEFYADVAPNDGAYNPPNGTWDSNTAIWTVAHILYSDFPNAQFAIPLPTPVPAVPASVPPVPRNALQGYTYYTHDARYNIMPSIASYSVALVSGRGTIASSTLPNASDGYGFTIKRELFDAASPTTPCAATTDRCVWLTNFADMTALYPSTIFLKGGAVNDPAGSVAGTVDFKTTYRALPQILSLPVTFL